MADDFILVKCPYCRAERAVFPEDAGLPKCKSCGRAYHLAEGFSRTGSVIPTAAAPQKVTTLDDTLQVFRERDLSSTVIARLPKGIEIVLSASTVFEGRDWIEATIEGVDSGYVLYPSARGHTTLEPSARPIVQVGLPIPVLQKPQIDKEREELSVREIRHRIETRSRRIALVRFWGCVAVICSFIVWGVVEYCSRKIYENNIRSRFAGELSNFVYLKFDGAPAPLPFTPPPKRAASPYVAGKVLIIDKTTESMAGIQLHLPEYLMPSSLSDVRTIVWLGCHKEVFGVYYSVSFGTRKDTGTAYRWRCDATVIDTIGPVITATNSFQGSEPPKQSHEITDGDHEGTRPDYELLAFVKSLPYR
jgi:hypothetical protein